MREYSGRRIMGIIYEMKRKIMVARGRPVVL
jgi:hypothetical protein